MEIVLVIVVLAVALLLITGPLRAGGGGAAATPGQSAERAELEAAKEAKYREIRDAELDYRTGKLSEEDWHRFDASLRAEAIELLRRLDALEARDRGEGVDSGSSR